MSDNRTADIPSYTLIDMHGDIHDVVYLEDAYKLSQQTASLREENEKLKSEAKEQYNAGLMCERILAKDQIKQLQEEVERLRGALKEIDYKIDNVTYLTDDDIKEIIVKALSSKESKPS